MASSLENLVSTASSTVLTSSTTSTSAPGILVEAMGEDQTSLYTDFTDDNPPVAAVRPPPVSEQDLKGSTAIHTADNPVQEKKPNAINFDRSRPYFCHVCQYDGNDMEVKI